MANEFNDLELRSNGQEVDASWWNSIIVALRNTFPGESSISGDIVGTTDNQTLTNKTINGDDNTITGLVHGFEVDNPTNNVHGVTGNVVGTTDTQNLTNKTFVDAIGLGELVATPVNPSAGVKSLYVKTDGKLYTLDSSGTEIEIGANANIADGSVTPSKIPDQKKVIKFLQSTKSSSSVDEADLRIIGLTIGKSYRVVSQAYISSSAASGASMFVKHDGVSLHRHNYDSAGTNFAATASGNSTDFVATDTEINVDLSLGTSTEILGAAGSDTERTWVYCLELPFNIDEVGSF